MIEAYAQAEEPMAPVFEHIRMKVAERQEAVGYLLDMGFIEQAGVVQGEDRTYLYRITPTGRLIASLSKTKLPAGRRGKKDAVAVESLAKRVTKSNPVTVFDLAAKPWRWNKKREAELEAQGYFG